MRKEKGVGSRKEEGAEHWMERKFVSFFQKKIERDKTQSVVKSHFFGLFNHLRQGKRQDIYIRYSL